MKRFFAFSFATLIVLTLAFFSFTSHDAKGQAQITPDAVFRTMEVRPSKSSNGTNTFTVYSKNGGGTNFLRIEPTNANINLRIVGSSIAWTGVTQTITFGPGGTNFSTNSTYIFKNGILVNGS